MSNKLHKAAADKENGHIKVKELIEQRNKDVNAFHTQSNTKPVDFAAQAGSLLTLKYLIEVANANLDASQNEHNLLFWALQNTSDIMEYLTDPALQLFQRFNDGTTNLHIAALTGQLEQVKKILADNPFRINDTDSRGNTALYWAALNDKPSIIHFILTHTAFLQLPNPDKCDSLFRGNIERLNRLLIDFEDQDDLGKTIELCKETIQCCDQIHTKNDNDYYRLVNAYNNLGRFYSEQNHITEGINAVEKAIMYCGKMSDSFENKSICLENTLENLGFINLKQDLAKEAKKWGFECQDVAMDGNCFFTAVVEQLKTKTDVDCSDLTHQEIRTQTVDHLSEYMDQYYEFINEDPEEFLNTMQEAGTWADHIVILAFSRKFNVNIVLIKSNGTDPQIFKQPHPQATLYLGYIVELHYQSLCHRPDWVADQSIATKIQQAELDPFTEKQALSTINSLKYFGSPFPLGKVGDGNKQMNVAASSATCVSGFFNNSGVITNHGGSTHNTNFNMK